MPKTYKAIFLDWDDTIGDWTRAEHKALNDIYHSYRLNDRFVSPDEFIAAYKPYNLELWAQYGRGDITKEQLHLDRFNHIVQNEPVARRMGDDFLMLTNRYFSLLPGASEIVRYLAAKYPLTIISNGFKEVQYYKFAHSGLQECFAHTIISEEFGVNKPRPQIFMEALRLNGITASEALMIGDSYSSDIQGAANAGIDQLWITAAPGANKATYIVSDIRAIRQLL